MKTKEEASGWPSDVRTEEEKARHVAEYEAEHGIRLDPSKIEKNPGRRSPAKLMLNSFWGKFGQRPNQTQVSTFTKPSEFFELIMNDSTVIHRIEIVNEEMVEVFHSYQEDQIPVQTITNIFVACFTTSYARLKLYDALDILNERVLNMDTDSVIYTCKPGETPIPTGKYLGQFSNELDPDDHIEEFITSGPKSYSFVTKNGKQCCKVRGFTLNVRGQSVLNFNSMRDLVMDVVLDPEEEETTLTLDNPHKIVRCPKDKKIKTIPQSKRYKLVFDKRVIDYNTLKSFPYGYGS